MTSNTSFVISGLLLVFIVIGVRSIPIDKTTKIIQAPSADHKSFDQQQPLKSVVPVKPASASPSSTTSSTPTASQSLSSTTTVSQDKNDNKKKRNIHDDERFDELGIDTSDETDGVSSNLHLDNDRQPDEHVLHPKMQETPVTIHENADKSVDTDDSSIFSDIRMTPTELTDIVRRRREVKRNGDANRRRKRALAPYDLYNTDSFYDAYADLVDGYEHARSTRAFAPIYWYPSVYERNIRSALAPSYYESSAWPQLYSSDIYDADDDDDNLASLYREDGNDDDDVSDYELNRYPILLQSANDPFDNLQLQQRYNTDDLPVDEDFEEGLNYENDGDGDDDGNDAQYRVFLDKQHPYYARYGSADPYFE